MDHLACKAGCCGSDCPCRLDSAREGAIIAKVLGGALLIIVGLWVVFVTGWRAGNPDCNWLGAPEKSKQEQVAELDELIPPDPRPARAVHVYHEIDGEAYAQRLSAEPKAIRDRVVFYAIDKDGELASLTPTYFLVTTDMYCQEVTESTFNCIQPGDLAAGYWKPVARHDWLWKKYETPHISSGRPNNGRPR
jgi:hypothetical protein